MGTQQPHIVIHNFDLVLPDLTVLIRNISLVVGNFRLGLVGPNGSGKSTLLHAIRDAEHRLMRGIRVNGKLAFVEQNPRLDGELTVFEYLGAHSQEDIHRALVFMSLGNIEGFEKIRELSAGQVNKLQLAKVILDAPDLVVLDEPSNHLDRDGRAALLRFISSWANGLILASHDRELLMEMDTIAEIYNEKMRLLGGNFEDFEAQREALNSAARQRLSAAEERLEVVRRQSRETAERQAKRNRRGKDKREKLGLPRILLGMMKANAERSTGRLNARRERLESQAQQQLHVARESLESRIQVQVDLKSTKTHGTRVIARCEDVNFTYNNRLLWSRPLSFVLFGKDRVLLSGPNGSGKTTLLELLTGGLRPSCGRIENVANWARLDQNVSILKEDATLLENMLEANPELCEAQARIRLGRFSFYNDDAFKRVNVLSGGEKMRAGLALLLAANQEPDFLILDEPTNNLDLDSVRELERVLSEFGGALLVVTHDPNFARALRLDTVIDLGCYFSSSSITSTGNCLKPIF